MSYLSKKKYEKQLADIRRDNASKARKRVLQEERKKYRPKIKLPSTSKMLLWTAVLLCMEILVFCQIAFFMTHDTSFLYVLAGIPATLVPTILGYYSKSKSENTAGGIVFETAVANMNTDGSGELVG